MAAASSNMTTPQSLNESSHWSALPNDTNPNYTQVRRSETLGNVSYSTRTTKPSSSSSKTQTPRTPWHILDSGSECTATVQSDAEDQASLKPEYLAYLSLLDPAQTPEGDDDGDCTDAVNNKCSNGVYADDKKADDEQQTRDEAHDKRTAIGDFDTTLSQTNQPKYINVAAARRLNATIDLTPCSSPEKSPISACFSPRRFSARRRSMASSQCSSTRSSTDGGSVLTAQTTKSSKRGSRETKSGWLSQIKEWTSVAEPSRQAIKRHKIETFGKAGIAPNDPRARAKLNLPTATLPPEAIKPAGRPLKPEETLTRQAVEQKKQDRWSMSSSLGRLSHASRSSMSGHSSSSSLGRTSTSKADA